MSIDQPRQPAGVPVGGQFATTSRPEAGVSLTPERKVLVGVNAVAELSTFGVEPLPEWPAELPAPAGVSYAWDDDGLLEVTIDTALDSFVVWGTPTDPQCNVDELPEEFEHLDDAVKAKVVAYGVRLHDNIHTLVNQATYPMHTDNLRYTVVNLATGGQGIPGAGSDGEAPRRLTSKERAAARAESNLQAWFATRTVDETTIQDTLTELLHLARTKGITPAQFGGIFHRAQGIYRAEVEDAEG